MVSVLMYIGGGEAIHHRHVKNVAPRLTAVADDGPMSRAGHSKLCVESISIYVYAE